MVEPTPSPGGIIGFLLGLLFLCPLVSDLAPLPQVDLAEPDDSQRMYLLFQTAVDGPDPAVLAETAAVVTGRLNILAERIDVTVEGSTCIAVAVPAAQDWAAISDLIQTTALLEFVDFSGLDADLTGQVIVTDVQGGYSVVHEDGLLHPLTDALFETVLTGDDVAVAEVVPSEYDPGSPLIQLTFTPDGAQAMETYTAAHIGEQLAIVLDGEVLMAPVIQTVLSDSAVITGQFTKTEVEQLAIQLNAGALPLPLELITTSVDGMPESSACD